ncbi:MAG TPA: exonuclease SbcCD subunit D [Anaerolineales bacterium]|nr:exonuclease SbcCD subunit D [Anaerolineales bacterium]
MRLLHFADAHIDMANYGRHDPESGLPLRVLDFLKSLDTIVDTAVDEHVDMVIFAGDAYKDRSPAPTFQREWGRRIIRLSQAHIPTLLLVGNHDLSPAAGRAHAIHEFDTLQVPYIKVLPEPHLYGPEELWGLGVQVIALPWISRSGLMAALDSSGGDQADVFLQIEERIRDLVEDMLEKADHHLPTILTAHASVQGATFGSERMVMLGSDLVLPTSLVRDPRLDYVALGHIHKPQDVNEGSQPPVVYPGSIERVDFGEADEDRYFVIADVSKGHTEVEWRKLDEVRRFIDLRAELKADQDVMGTLMDALGDERQLDGAIIKLTVEYPREYNALIDEAALRKHAAKAFEFHLVKRPQNDTRIRLPADQTISSLSPLELLEQYWKAGHADPAQTEALKRLARDIIAAEDGPEAAGG